MLQILDNVESNWIETSIYLGEQINLFTNWEALATTHRQNIIAELIHENEASATNTYAFDIKHFADAIEHVVWNAAEAARHSRNSVDEIVWHWSYDVTDITYWWTQRVYECIHLSNISQVAGVDQKTLNLNKN